VKSLVNVFNYCLFWGGLCCAVAFAVGLSWSCIAIGLAFVVFSRILDEIYHTFVETRHVDKF